MFKKLHSNRDPENTVFSEIKKEFRPYFNQAEDLIVTFMNRNPETIFKGMVILILISLILSFVVFRDKDSGKTNSSSAMVEKNNKQVQNSTSDGFNQILRTSAGLKETIALKQDIELIIAKKELSTEDSVRLQKSLERLEQLNEILK